MTYHLKLKKALSYNGIVCATRKNPDVYTEDKKVADAAVATGYFELVVDAPDTESPADGKTDMVKGHLDFDQLKKMGKDELKDLAEKLGIDATGLKTKEDYAKAIAAVECEAPADGEGTEVDFSQE